MNTIKIREQINKYLDGLSSESLEVVVNFLAYVKGRESEAATQELIDIPGFIESFEKGKKDIARGRVKNWINIKSDV